MWLIWVGLFGCGGASEARAVVTELCRWGQLSELQPAILPPDLDLATRVRDADLRWARAEKLAPSTENPFLALNQTVGLVAEGPARALSQAVADHARCEVVVTLDGRRGTAHVKRVSPRPLEGEDLYVKVRELQNLATYEEQVARVGEWITSRPDATRTDEYDLVVEKHDGGWMVNFGFPEARLAESQATLEQAEATIAAGRSAEIELAKLVILEARWFERASSKSSANRLDITARNDLDVRISKVVLHGTITTPDKETPWVDDELTHVPLSRFEPGDQDTWTIVSRLPSSWRTGAPDGATVTLKPIELYGPGGKLLYDVGDLDDAIQTAERMQAEIERVKATYLAPGVAG